MAKKIADSQVEKVKKSKEDDWLKNAAEELGESEPRADQETAAEISAAR